MYFRSSLLKSIPNKIHSLVLPRLLQCNNNTGKTCAFVDSRGNSFGFIDTTYVEKTSLPLSKLHQPRVLRVVDSRESKSRKVTHFVTCHIQIGNHSESAHFFVTKLGQFPIILGHGWLSNHNPEIH